MEFKNLSENEISSLTREEANAVISDNLEMISKLLAQCEAVATTHELEFGFHPVYGMGGWFASGEWNPSSQSC